MPIRTVRYLVIRIGDKGNFKSIKATTAKIEQRLASLANIIPNIKGLGS